METFGRNTHMIKTLMSSYESSIRELQRLSEEKKEIQQQLTELRVGVDTKIPLTPVLQDTFLAHMMAFNEKLEEISEVKVQIAKTSKYLDSYLSEPAVERVKLTE
jgi:hypothetical protein